MPDSAVQISGDTLTINLQDVAVVDQLQFPGGTGNAPVTLSYVATYRKSGNPRQVRPISHDPLSAFNWAGEMWEATNSGNFSVAYDDGSFKASGAFDSSGNFGEMGTERNGSFSAADATPAHAATQSGAIAAMKQTPPAASLWHNSEPLWKGRVPLSQLGLLHLP